MLFLCGLTFLNWRQTTAYETRRQAAQAAAREDWLNQGNHDPHSAAHHGTDLYKPMPVLAFFDSGLFPALGTAVRVEAHQLKRPTNRPNENEVQVQQPLVASPALVLQMLLPLLIIGLGFSAISREREEGTLALTLSHRGVWRYLLIAKSVAILLIVLGVTAPAWISVLAAVWTPDSVSVAHPDIVSRALTLLAGLFLYSLVWILLAVGVSARTTSRTSLAVLLGAWTFWTLILPPITLDLALQSHPLPTSEEMKQWQDDEVRYGDNGKNSYRRIYRELEEKLLKEHGVAKKEDLPINFEGASMLAAEEFSDKLIDRGQAKLDAISATHERFLRIAAVVSPYLTMRGISMAFSGTDHQHHNHFANAVEHYRRDLVRRMNEALLIKLPRGEQKADRRPLWESVPEFAWVAPSSREVWQTHGLQFLCLILWLCAAGGFVLCAAPRL